ncbi:MAG: thiol:disulfide interchange protein DsbG [Xanthomonadales bacterium]|nr:thiol:disulfide interchange protein DsbG [Xanthomonadales bacterium]
MISTRHLASAIACLGLLLLAPLASAAGKDTPAVIRTLEQKGLGNVQEFDAGPNLRGFAGVAGQQPIAVYVTPDGNAIVGSRVGADGSSLDEQRLHDLVAKPMGEAILAKLKASTWVQDGKSDAPRIIYTFSDPNCPYCNRFFQAARPWVDAGKVQLRHVMVGVIKADSSTKAAAILTAKDRTAALLQNEHAFAAGGIDPAPGVPAGIRQQLDANQALMSELGFRGTPGIVYVDADGTVQRANGMPQPEQLDAMMGPR